MILIMLINLYISRIILQVLGVKDYGIYNVVGGFVALFAFLSNSLSAAITRFITFELGTGDKIKLSKIFSSALVIQFVISFIIVLLIEGFGVWFLNNKMVLESGRLMAANWCLQLSMITFCINIIAVPYNALIVAHEKMSVFAYISILEASMKLIICFIVMYSPIDKLVSYAILLTLVALLVRFIYVIYCHRNFEESKFHLYFDKNLLIKMFTFSGWNFIGAGAGVLREQGVNVIINIFFGTAVNAARGIALQVSAAVSSFSTSFITAINPQITKSYASNDKKYSFLLVMQGARLSFYLLLLLALPVFLETPILLRTWLTIVPEYTIIFVRLILIYVMTESLSNTMMTLMLATGNIRNYQLIVGGLQLLNFPLSYVILELGYSPEWTIIVAIFVAFVCLFVRLFLLNKMTGLPITTFIYKVIFNVFSVTCIGTILPMFIVFFIDEGFLRLLLTSVVSVISLIITYLFIGCTLNERQFVISKVKSKIR